jgi:hypothetical protein
LHNVEFALAFAESIFQLHYGVEGEFLAKGAAGGKQDDVTGLAPDEMWGDSTIHACPAAVDSGLRCVVKPALLMPRWAK